MQYKVGLVLIAVFSSFAFEADSVSQWGIGFHFSKKHTVGQYANGDYWVLGPVTIDSITPKPIEIESDSFIHGWQVDPLPTGLQTLDYRLQRYSAPDTKFPKTFISDCSILKVISLSPPADRPRIKVASVLTVVTEIPENNGAGIFRPPYVSTDKKKYYVDSVDFNKLPKLDFSSGTIPNMDNLYGEVRKVQMDHLSHSNQWLRPLDAMPFYAADVNKRNSEAILRLCLNESNDFKKPLCIAMIQTGIDYFYFFINGNEWNLNAQGEQPGNFLPITFAGYILNDSTINSTVSSYDSTYEQITCFYNSSNVALWGHDNILPTYEETYWNKLVNHSATGRSTLRDPYHLIDGGYIPGGGYQFCCTSQPFKGTALILWIIPGMRAIWNPSAMISYVERWVDHGIWTKPDSCAPAKGVYGVDYGPNPNPDDDGCIPDTNYSDGIGRFPELHGTDADAGQRSSNFVNALWLKYKKNPENVPSAPLKKIQIVLPPYDTCAQCK